jgi:hypothetical protein
MSSPRFEAFLARLYTDDGFRRRFLADPRALARHAGLDAPAIEALVRIDRAGLELAARSFAHRRAARGPGRRGWRRWLARWGADALTRRALRR